jgi:hypothetical protein
MHPPSEPATDLRYPIGRFRPDAANAGQRRLAIQAIAALPVRLAEALAGLSEVQHDTQYRDGGWTLRQVAHHVADSHMNAYTRLRLALTEEWPTIKPYDQGLWAQLPDARTLPVEASLALLAPLHRRWIALLNSLDEVSWLRGYTHPESGRTTIETMTSLYSWHGRHHTAHITALRERMGW